MFPRPIWIAFSHIIMIIVYLLFALGQRIVLVASTPVLGLYFGFHSAVMVPTVSELFGLKHFGSFFNFILLGNPLGALLFSVLLAGHLYDAEAAKQHPGFLSHSSVTCLGPSCFRLTFLILAGLCSLGSFLSVILTVRRERRSERERATEEREESRLRDWSGRRMRFAEEWRRKELERAEARRRRREVSSSAARGGWALAAAVDGGGGGWVIVAEERRLLS